MNTTTPKKRNSSIIPGTKPVQRSSSIIVEGNTNHMYAKHDKSKCKHCLRILETKKSLKTPIEAIKVDTKPKVVRKGSFAQAPHVHTPQKRPTAIIVKPKEVSSAYQTPVKYSSPAIKETGLDEPFLEVRNKKHPDIDFIFDPKRDRSIPYHLDGNSKMYTADIISKREALKNDEDIKKAITNFMQLYNFDKNNVLSKYQYIQTHVKIACLLRPDLKDPNFHQELLKLMEQDWKHDTKGVEEMTFEKLEKSLFEMADIWTTGIEKEEYVSFFNVLKTKFILDEEKNQKVFSELYQA